MAKPIIMLRTEDNDREDTPRITKYLTQRLVDGNFRNLVDYLADPRADDFNTALQSNEELNVSEKVKGYITKNDPQLKLRFYNAQGASNILNLDDRVSDHLGNILVTKQDTIDGVQTSYQQASLLINDEQVGGYF